MWRWCKSNTSDYVILSEIKIKIWQSRSLILGMLNFFPLVKSMHELFSLSWRILPPNLLIVSIMTLLLLERVAKGKDMVVVVTVHSCSYDCHCWELISRPPWIGNLVAPMIQVQGLTSTMTEVAKYGGS